MNILSLLTPAMSTALDNLDLYVRGTVANELQMIRADQRAAARKLDRYNWLLFAVAVLLAVLIVLVILLWTPLGAFLMNELKVFVWKTTNDALAGLSALADKAITSLKEMSTLLELCVFCAIGAIGLWKRSTLILMAATVVGTHVVIAMSQLGGVAEVTAALKGIPMVVNSKLPVD